MYCCSLQGQHKLAFICCLTAIENENQVIWSVLTKDEFSLFSTVDGWYASFNQVLLDFYFLSRLSTSSLTHSTHVVLI